jgi:hypothetical protein
MARRKKLRTNYKLPLEMDLLTRLAPLLVHPGLMADDDRAGEQEAGL